LYEQGQKDYVYQYHILSLYFSCQDFKNNGFEVIRIYKANLISQEGKLKVGFESFKIWLK